MASETLHEDPEKLGSETLDQHRAVVSLMEELEAIDWYQQRVKATTDEDLRHILAHNRDEEMEHAAMVLEWLRRRDPTFAGHLRTYLFSEGPIGEREAGAAAGGETTPGAGLGIGSLKPREA
jgi:ferritin-like protein